jgi:hypothetical protein
MAHPAPAGFAKKKNQIRYSPSFDCILNLPISLQKDINEVSLLDNHCCKF